jgi:SAM-dependent methyltransferase
MDAPGALDTATADGHDRHVPTGSKDLLTAGHEGVYAWACEQLVTPGASFLDLGCGTGYGASRVVASGAVYDGIDSSPTAIDYARSHFSRPGVRFFVADLLVGAPAGIASRSYDIVFSSEVLEHVVDPFAFVEVMAGLARDDGVCFIGTPNRLWSKARMPRGQLLAESHVMEFTPPALAALLRTAFEDVTLLFRRLPAAADALITPASGRKRITRAAMSRMAELSPGAALRMRRAWPERADGREWSPDDIAWLRSDDPQLDVGECVGLVAVCRRPRR